MTLNDTLSYGRIFLHFFDIHFLEEVGAINAHEGIFWECRLATRLSVAAAECVFVPAASFIESELCRKALYELKELFPLGVIELVGGSGHLSEFCEERLNLYPEKSNQHNKYLEFDLHEFVPPFRQKIAKTTSDIKIHWKNILEMGVSSQNLLAGLDMTLPSDFENKWESVPDLLGNQAFILDHVQPFLGTISTHPTVKRRLHNIINAGYFASYTNDLLAGVVSDLIYLNSGAHLTSNGPNLPYRQLLNSLRREGLLEHVVRCKPLELLELNNNVVWKKCLSEVNSTKRTIDLSRTNFYLKKEIQMKNQFFIVHGHDHKILYELKDYLQNRLHFPEPTILMQKPNSGRTIIEKFEDYAEQVDGAMVLLTPDDLVGQDVNQTNRARQNVIFELGYFVAKFGRKSGRVMLLHLGDTEIPSDLNGVIYINVSGGIESAGEKIRKELGL